MELNSTSTQPKLKQHGQQSNRINQLLEEWWHRTPEDDIRNLERDQYKQSFRDGNELSKSLEQALFLTQ